MSPTARSCLTAAIWSWYLATITTSAMIRLSSSNYHRACTSLASAPAVTTAMIRRFLTQASAEERRASTICESLSVPKLTRRMRFKMWLVVSLVINPSRSMAMQMECPAVLTISGSKLVHLIAFFNSTLVVLRISKARSLRSPVPMERCAILNSVPIRYRGNWQYTR